MNRVGMGYDVHQLVTGRKLVLGGVEIPFEKGLDGHSDADVLIHAIADSLLGAMGETDIGHYFPNTDPQWKGCSSLVFLEKIKELADKKWATILNIDATLIGERPKIAPHLAEMKTKISKALGITMDQVGIKATTNERIGFIGREEGMAAMSVALVDFK
ncbi:MAG: 2-C-methyl-D-erythritol 2,4-cyclodiphosphate synthase [Verrucomicrobiota bacterium]